MKTLIAIMILLPFLSCSQDLYPYGTFKGTITGRANNDTTGLVRYPAKEENGRLTGVTYNPIMNSIQLDCTHVHLQFSLLSAKPELVRKRFFEFYSGTEQEYDCWVASFKFGNYGSCRHVDVRFSVHGKIAAEYTFAEFKKLIWP